MISNQTSSLWQLTTISCFMYFLINIEREQKVHWRNWATPFLCGKKSLERDSKNNLCKAPHGVKLYGGRDLDCTSRTPVALTSHLQVLQETTACNSFIFSLLHLDSSEGQFPPQRAFILVFRLRFMTCSRLSAILYFSFSFQPISLKGICLSSILSRFFHVKSRSRPCRYWLFDQAWESCSVVKRQISCKLLTNCYKPITSS